MAKSEGAEARKLGPQELERAIDEAHRQLFHLRFQLATKQLTNHRQIRKVKRHLARLKTIQRESPAKRDSARAPSGGE